MTEVGPAPATTPRRLTLFIFSLQVGGAQRALSLLAALWVEQGHEVTIVTLDDPAADFYEVPPEVRRVALGGMASSAGRLRRALTNVTRIPRLRCALSASRPDLVISFVDRMNVLALLATFASGIPIVVSERTDPRHHHVGVSVRALRRLLYRRAAAVVVQSEEVADWARRVARPDGVHVIPNVVLPVEASDEPRQRLVVGVGRLSREKGFDLLIDAFAAVAASHPDWSLRILGEGPERPVLEARVAALGLDSRAELPGLAPDPGATLARAGIFVLPSRYEGFPNALLEAMAAGAPSIAFDCPVGPRQIIRHGVDGLLVAAQDVAALARALSALMDDDALRDELGAQGRDVVGRFSPSRIAHEWQAVIEAAT